MSKIVTALLCLICFSSTAHPAEKPSAAGNTIVVLLDKSPSGFVTTVDSRPSRGLLRTLIALNKDGKAQAVLLVHEDASLKAISNLEGTMAKAGLVSPRVFTFDKGKTRMEEITYSSPVPFSEDASKLTPPKGKP